MYMHTYTYRCVNAVKRIISDVIFMRTYEINLILIGIQFECVLPLDYINKYLFFFCSHYIPNNGFQ